MKQVLLSLLLAMAIVTTQAQNVGIGTNMPHPSAKLDISDTSKGLLIPRMTAEQRRNISTPADGLMVFQINDTAGIYLAKAGIWHRLEIASSSWSIKGNAGIIDSLNFIGTTDSTPLNFRVNNQSAGKIDPIVDNSFFGYLSGTSNTTGCCNAALGNYALYSNTTGSGNTSNGYGALALNTTGEGNVGIGEEALVSNTSGSYNTSTGTYALYSNTTGIGNTANGVSALRSNTVGFGNIAIGSSALYSNINGHSNLAIGRKALYSNISGVNNYAIGEEALYQNKTGIENIALGKYSLLNNISGFKNIAIGYLSLARNTNGTNNTAIGNGAGNSNVADNNIIIGNNAGANSAFDSISNKLIIDNSGTDKPLIYGDFEQNSLKINGEIDSPVVKNFLGFNDYDPNSHINTYENDIDNPIIYSRYFFGRYKDLIIQGLSKVYTGNIHFVTGSTVTGATPPTQRMVIMDNGKVGIGNFNFSPQGPPRSKLEVRDGDVYLSNATNGIILTAPNGSCWRVTVANDGSLVRTAISCPSY